MKPNLSLLAAIWGFAVTCTGQVSITLSTVPAGLVITIDGLPAVSPRTLAWMPGSTHTISAGSPQGGDFTRYLFSSWSDGGAATHTYTVPSSASTVTANFVTQHRLTRAAVPVIGGTVVAIPPAGDGFYNDGTVVQMTASPVAGFAFTGYSGVVSGSVPSQAVVMSEPRSVTAAFGLVAGSAKSNAPPRVVFRDIWGGIRANVFGSLALLTAGGVFGGDPQVVVNADGDATIAGLDTYGSIWLNTLRASDLQFTGWRNAAGNIQGVPAVALAPSGSIYIAVRDTGNAYWLNSYNSVAGLGNWIRLGGIFSSDPAMAFTPDGVLHLIGKDMWNALWAGDYSPSTGFQNWRLGGGTVQGKPAVTGGTDGAVYVAVRDTWGGLWVSRLQNGSWLGWSFGGGIMVDDPRIVNLGNGLLVAVIRDGWNNVWYRQYTEGTAGGWLSWIRAGGGVTTASAAAVDGELFIAGAKTTGEICWFRSQDPQWTIVGFRGLISGNVSAGPR